MLVVGGFGNEMILKTNAMRREAVPLWFPALFSIPRVALLPCGEHFKTAPPGALLEETVCEGARGLPRLSAPHGALLVCLHPGQNVGNGWRARGRGRGKGAGTRQSRRGGRRVHPGQIEPGTQMRRQIVRKQNETVRRPQKSAGSAIFHEGILTVYWAGILFLFILKIK